MSKQTYAVGALMRGAFRSMMREVIFYDPSARYEEVKSFLSSKFLVEADEKVINEIDKLCGKGG